MISYLNGKIAELNPAYAIIDCSGIGYYTHISLNTYTKLNGKTEYKLLTHLVIREDAHLLYGFAEEAERTMFLQLISVSGVGPNTARMILSSQTPGDIAAAIDSENVDLLKSIKGIGLKTAQRIIVDLAGKVAKGGVSIEFSSGVNNTKRSEALSALVVLGFDKKLAEKTVERVLTANPEASLEELVKQTLKSL
ncbi:MAG: Holliday junction branch migration protein RuvA [Flavobacteriales bacterium]